MLRTLPESQRTRSGRTGGVALSVVLHAAIVGGAVLGTLRSSHADPAPPAPVQRITYVISPEPRAPRPAPPQPRRAPAPQTEHVIVTPLPDPGITWTPAPTIGIPPVRPYREAVDRTGRR